MTVAGPEKEKLTRQLEVFGAHVLTALKERVKIVVVEDEDHLFPEREPVAATARAWQAVQNSGVRDSRELPLWLARALDAGAHVYDLPQMRRFLLAHGPRHLTALTATTPNTMRPPPYRSQAVSALLQQRPTLASPLAHPPSVAVPPPAAKPHAHAHAHAHVHTHTQVARLSGTGPATEYVCAPDKHGSTVPRLHPNPPPGVTPFWRSGESTFAVGRKPLPKPPPVGTATGLPRREAKAAAPARGTCELCGNEEYKSLAEHLASAKHKAAFNSEWRYRYLEYELY